MALRPTRCSISSSRRPTLLPQRSSHTAGFLAVVSWCSCQRYRSLSLLVQGDWLALDWGDALNGALKQKYRIWSGRESGTYGRGRRSGVPAVIVIDKSGKELAFLPGERYGAAALYEWQPTPKQAWPDEL